jgi:hypothetical protein
LDNLLNIFFLSVGFGPPTRDTPKLSNFNFVEDQKGELINNNPIIGIDSALTSPALNFHDGIIGYKSLRISGFASAMSQKGFGYSQTGNSSCDQFISTIANKDLFKVNLIANYKGNKVVIKSDTITFKGGFFSPMQGACMAFTNVLRDKGIYYDINVSFEYIPLDSSVMKGNSQIKFSGLNPEKESYLEISRVQ